MTEAVIIYLLCKSMDWFLYDNGLRHERVKHLHKMVKQTQTIRRQQPKNCLSVFDHFVGLAFKGSIWVSGQKFTFFSQKVAIIWKKFKM